MAFPAMKPLNLGRRGVSCQEMVCLNVDILTDLTEDSLLAGRVRLMQPRNGLRAGLDAVLLAAAVPARANEQVIEAGCGSGAAFLCLLARQPALTVVAVERDPELAEIARRNAALNGVSDRVTVLTGDITSDAIRRALPRCHHAFANPPYWPQGSLPPDARRASATHTSGGPALDQWVQSMAEALIHRGSLTLILPAARHAEAGAILRNGNQSGGVSLMPLWPRQGREAKRVLIQSLRRNRGPDRLLPGLLLHNTHGWSDVARSVLEDGAALQWQ